MPYWSGFTFSENKWGINWDSITFDLEGNTNVTLLKETENSSSRGQKRKINRFKSKVVSGFRSGAKRGNNPAAKTEIKEPIRGETRV